MIDVYIFIAHIMDPQLRGSYWSDPMQISHVAADKSEEK
jgi:hypothetical protein